MIGAEAIMRKKLDVALAAGLFFVCVFSWAQPNGESDVLQKAVESIQERTPQGALLIVPGQFANDVSLVVEEGRGPLVITQNQYKKTAKALPKCLTTIYRLHTANHLGKQKKKTAVPPFQLNLTDDFVLVQEGDKR